jgi:hypothetical protein
LQTSGARWGERLDIIGRIRFLQDAGLDDIAAHISGNRPLIVFVEELRPKKSRSKANPVVLTPVVMFESNDPELSYGTGPASYTFVHCSSSDDKNIDDAVEWIDEYVAKYNGKVITNFDEQLPRLAGAPLSYQRLVENTYDKNTLQYYTGQVTIRHVDHLNFQGVHVGHNINVGGNAIVNIDSTLSNVSQTVGASQGLNTEEKSKLDALVNSLKAELDTLKTSHSDEVQEIADSLQKVVTAASKPPEERKKRFLDLSAINLIQAAQLVDKAAPTVVHIATQIAHFLQGLIAS